MSPIDMVVAQDEEMTPVEHAELALRDAVATGDRKRVDKAARKLQDARDEVAKQAQRARDIGKATQEANLAAHTKKQAERKLEADAVEAELRATSEPYAAIYDGAGHVVYIDLSVCEIVARQTALEAARRVCFRVSENFQARVAESRNILAVAEARDVITPLLNSGDGLLHAVQRGVVQVEDVVKEEKPS